MYEIHLEQYTGPLDKLLQLIEEKHLEITTINLAEVTVDFLEYLKKIGNGASPQVLADFLVIAAQLVLIKSKILLPTIDLSEEEERDIKDLELRLELYREFSAREGGAALHIRAMWEGHKRLYVRQFFLTRDVAPVFYPAPNVSIETLHRAFAQGISFFEELKSEPNKIKAVLVSLEEKVKEIVNRFKVAAAQSFKSITENRSKSEVVVLFLAVLHLLKEERIKVAQDNHFGDILVEQRNLE